MLSLYSVSLNGLSPIPNQFFSFVLKGALSLENLPNLFFLELLIREKLGINEFWLCQFIHLCATPQESFETSSEALVSPTVDDRIPPGVHTRHRICPVHMSRMDYCWGKKTEAQNYQQRHKATETQPHNDGHSTGSFHLTLHS